MTAQVCIALVCVFCDKAILPGERFGCEVEDDDDGRCWHAPCEAVVPAIPAPEKEE